MVETTNNFLNGQLRVRRVPNGFCSGSDAVFLAAFMPTLAVGARVLDAGCGNGAAALCLAAMQPTLHITAYDIAPECVASAQGSIADSGLQSRVQAHVRDIATLPHDHKHNLFDAVLTNPPYYEASTVRLPAHPLRQAAMVGVGIDRTQWVQNCAKALRPHGVLNIIFPACDEWLLYNALHKYVGGIEVFPLFPRAHLPASRVLWRGVRGSKAALKRYRGLVLHPQQGDGYTPQADAVLRGRGSLW